MKIPHTMRKSNTNKINIVFCNFNKYEQVIPFRGLKIIGEVNIFLKEIYKCLYAKLR
jgi:hypothetical protein